MNPKENYYELKHLSEILSIPEDEKIILSDRLTTVQVLSMCSDRHVEHVVQKTNLKTENELRLSTFTSESPDMFFKYPLSVIMGVENPTEQSESEKTGLSLFLTLPEEKSVVLDKLNEFVGIHCKRQTIIDDICLAADELISNCIFNAPYVNMENSNSTIERSYSKVSIDPKKKPQIFAGFEANRVIIGCTDFYGRLNINKLIERIKLCYIHNPGNMINQGEGGAGIGSYMVFDSCMSYYVAVDPGKMTTICCAFPINMSARERNEIPKNVHIILNQSET